MQWPVLVLQQRLLDKGHYKSQMIYMQYGALSIYRGHLSSYNPRKTPHSSHLRESYGVSKSDQSFIIVIVMLCVP